MASIVRKARANDYEAVAGLNRQVQDQHAEVYPALFRAATPDTLTRTAYEALLADPTTTVLVVQDGPDVRGYLAAEVIERLDTPYRYGHRVLYINQICVDRSVRGTGDGRRLMDAAIGLADQLGVKRVELDTWGANTGARRFFEAVGFREHNIRLSLDLPIPIHGAGAGHAGEID